MQQVETQAPEVQQEKQAVIQTGSPSASKSSSASSPGAEGAAPKTKSVAETVPLAQPTSLKRQKSHQRASVACCSCRDRRIRCVVPPGETECTQCKRAGVQCIIKNDDERRRPISRAYMASLTDRVALLETMLKDQGMEVPVPNYPPKIRNAPRNEPKSPPATRPPNSSNNDHSSPGSQADENGNPDNFTQRRDSNQHIPDHDMESDVQRLDQDTINFTTLRKDGLVNRLLSTQAHLSFDQISGRLRYFGPTTNCHVLSELGIGSSRDIANMEQTRRAERLISRLSIDTYEYLMDLFWHNYNSVLHVLHQEAFNQDRDLGRSQFYSPFLHICVLAMGFRFADRNRPDIQLLALPQAESTFHREAKYMLDYELERPGGIPSVVSMLLLGDLECGVGRDNVGWLYAGMAVRLAFDIGLHLDTRNAGLPEREVQIRHMTLWACVIYDKYWALFLGRPTSMKSTDLEIYSLSKRFERLGDCKPAGPQKNLETQIYEALLDLMELAGKITENMDPRLGPDMTTDHNAYLRMASLDREMNSWYSRLPDVLKWTASNITSAPFSFFLLHQQFHSALILLHRPFAMYEEPSGPQGDDNNGPNDHFSTLSRIVCTKNAIRVAAIFWQHRQRFDTTKIFVTGLQHAGTAAIALVAAIASTHDLADRNDKMQYLEILGASLQDMAFTYQPAQRMSVVLQAVISELKGSPTLAHSVLNNARVVPARRESSNDEHVPGPFKKRQTSRPDDRFRSIDRIQATGNGFVGSSYNRKSSTSRRAVQYPSSSTTMNAPSFAPIFDAGTLAEISRQMNGGSDTGSVDVSLSTPNNASTNTVSHHANGADHQQRQQSQLSNTENYRSYNNDSSQWIQPDPDSASIVHLANIHFPELPSLASNNSQINYHGHEHEWQDWQMSNDPDSNNTALGSTHGLDQLQQCDKFDLPFSVSPGCYGAVAPSDILEE